MPEPDQEESFDELLGCEQDSDEDLEVSEAQPPQQVTTKNTTNNAPLLSLQPYIDYQSEQQAITLVDIVDQSIVCNQEKHAI